MTRLLFTPDAEHAAQTAAALIDEFIETRLRETGQVHIALAGGTTPRRAYELLAGLRAACSASGVKSRRVMSDLPASVWTSTSSTPFSPANHLWESVS